MANDVFNIARGRIGYYATQAGVGNAAFIVVLLQNTGLEADDTLNNHDTLAAVLAAANTECDFTNYARTVITSVTPDLDDTANTLDEVIGNLVYTDAGNGTNNTISKILVCFDADTTGGTDANIVPLTYHDASVTTDGSTVTFTEDAAGFWGSA
jgi:hypothetical protein